MARYKMLIRGEVGGTFQYKLFLYNLCYVCPCKSWLDNVFLEKYIFR